MNEITLAGRFALGFVFAMSAIAKLRNPRGFVRGVDRYRFLPRGLVAPAAVALILFECAVALSLLVGTYVVAGVVVALMFIILFTILMVHNARRVQPLPCYCFGMSDETSHPRRVLLRLSLLLLFALGLTIGVLDPAVPFPTYPPLSFEAILLASAILVLGSWFLHVPELRELHRAPVPGVANPGNRISLRDVPLGELASPAGAVLGC